MGWLVQIQKYSEKGLLTYESYKFETKEEAERFRDTLQVHSELLHINKWGSTWLDFINTWSLVRVCC